MNVKVIFLLLAATSASAQPACPPIHFLNANTVDLTPTLSSHLVLLRQEDSSYTAYELANASPYRLLRTIPHFEKQFSNCLPRQVSHVSGRAASPQVNSINTTAQPAAIAVLGSGNYLFAALNGGNSIHVMVFDQHLRLIAEDEVGTQPFDQPSPGSFGKYLSLVLTDVNGDGKVDVVAQYELVHGLDGAIGGGGVIVLLGDDTGGFHAAGGFPLTGTVNGSMAVGDLNGDDKPDIVVGAPSGAFQKNCGSPPAGNR